MPRKIHFIKAIFFFHICSLEVTVLIRFCVGLMEFMMESLPLVYTLLRK